MILTSRSTRSFIPLSIMRHHRNHHGHLSRLTPLPRCHPPPSPPAASITPPLVTTYTTAGTTTTAAAATAVVGLWVADWPPPPRGCLPPNNHRGGGRTTVQPPQPHLVVSGCDGATPSEASGLYVVVGIDIPDGMLMPDAVERLKQVASLERSNVRLRGTMMMEIERADRMRFRRLETFALRRLEHDYHSFWYDPEAIKELVNRRVEEALATYEATRAANALEAENQSQNGTDDDNGNVGNGNGKNGNSGNGNQNKNDRGARLVAQECTYQDFIKCQPLNFKGTKGVVSALTWWNSHKRTVGTDAAFAMSWRELMKLMAEVYSPRNEIQKMESVLWSLTVKNNDLATYT
nr:hypothetical protein [Tanacetum cinerariifolium]